ncbi:hypothetical protein O181_078158 [Austropuccinia psidii MF-1]|uniref:ferroxidase n=1 Tax=Austropuccinia psidii MF-1 TaxID=1389203 RepID=A0A9Q3FE79_9BASI|nr:hypothetical protein [Austropuccinia psidii MF-1]
MGRNILCRKLPGRPMLLFRLLSPAIPRSQPATGRQRWLADHVAQTRGHSSCLRSPRQNYSVDSARTNHLPLRSSDLSLQEYHQLSDETLNHLTEALEQLIESNHPNVTGWDVDYSSGVLNFHMGSHGTYVLNKQPPNKQIWLSSPLSGPKRFDYDKTEECWFYNRDQSKLKELLCEEVTKETNGNLKPYASCEKLGLEQLENFGNRRRYVVFNVLYDICYVTNSASYEFLITDKAQTDPLDSGNLQGGPVSIMSFEQEYRKPASLPSSNGLNTTKQYHFTIILEMKITEKNHQDAYGLIGALI